MIDACYGSVRVVLCFGKYNYYALFVLLSMNGVVIRCS
jgi:hypothetical protein